jgi:hypothetical protein
MRSSLYCSTTLASRDPLGATGLDTPAQSSQAKMTISEVVLYIRELCWGETWLIMRRENKSFKEQSLVTPLYF